MEVSSCDSLCPRNACPVCLNAFSDCELGKPDNCNHLFCLDCILEWSKNVNTCPVDRVSFNHILVLSSHSNKVIRKMLVPDRRFEDVLIDPEELTFCEICHQSTREDLLLLCDGCDKGFHTYCLSPPLANIPRGNWYCPDCVIIVFGAEDDDSSLSVTIEDTSYIPSDSLTPPLNVNTNTDDDNNMVSESGSGSSSSEEVFCPKRLRSQRVAVLSSSSSIAASSPSDNDSIKSGSLSYISISSGEGPARDAVLLKSTKLEHQTTSDLDDLFNPTTSRTNSRRFVSPSSPVSSIVSGECDDSLPDLSTSSVHDIVNEPQPSTTVNQVEGSSAAVTKEQTTQNPNEQKNKSKKNLSRKKTKRIKPRIIPSSGRRARTAATPRYNQSFREAVIASHRFERSIDGLREARKVILQHRSSPIKFPGMSGSSNSGISIPKVSKGLSDHGRHIVPGSSISHRQASTSSNHTPAFPLKNTSQPAGQPPSKIIIPELSKAFKPKRLHLDSISLPQTTDYVGLIKEDLEDLGTDQCVFNRDGSIVPIRAPTDTPTITMEDSEDTDQSLLRPFTCTSSHLMSQPSSSSSPKYHIPIKQTPSIRPFNESSEKKRKRNSGKSGNTREKLKKVCEHDQKQQFGKNDYMISSSSSSVGGGTENSCVSTRKSRKKYYTGRSPMYDSSYNNNNNHYSSTVDSPADDVPSDDDEMYESDNSEFNIFFDQIKQTLENESILSSIDETGTLHNYDNSTVSESQCDYTENRFESSRVLDIQDPSPCDNVNSIMNGEDTGYYSEDMIPQNVKSPISCQSMLKTQPDVPVSSSHTFIDCLRNCKAQFSHFIEHGNQHDGSSTPSMCNSTGHNPRDSLKPFPDKDDHVMSGWHERDGNEQTHYNNQFGLPDTGVSRLSGLPTTTDSQPLQQRHKLWTDNKKNSQSKSDMQKSHLSSYATHHSYKPLFKPISSCLLNPDQAVETVKSHLELHYIAGNITASVRNDIWKRAIRKVKLSTKPVPLERVQKLVDDYIILYIRQSGLS